MSTIKMLGISMSENITCTGDDGIERVFKYTQSYSAGTDSLDFHVHVIDGSTQEFFELCLKKVGPTTMRVAMMNHHYAEQYSRKGIPETIIPTISKKLNIKIMSSPAVSSDNSTWRIPQATKAWERMVKANLASYDSENDIYSTT